MLPLLFIAPSAAFTYLLSYLLFSVFSYLVSQKHQHQQQQLQRKESSSAYCFLPPAKKGVFSKPQLYTTATTTPTTSTATASTTVIYLVRLALSGLLLFDCGFHPWWLRILSKESIQRP